MHGIEWDVEIEASKSIGDGIAGWVKRALQWMSLGSCAVLLLKRKRKARWNVEKVQLGKRKEQFLTIRKYKYEYESSNRLENRRGVEF
jgi:hypothetical protein